LDAKAYSECERPERVAELLGIFLKRILSKRPENLSPLKNLSEDAPDWLKTKWGEEKFECFDDMRDSSLDDKVSYIAYWLDGALKEREKGDKADISCLWLDDVDEKNRPKKLRKLGSLEQACHEAEKAIRIDAMKGHKIYEADRIIKNDRSVEIVKRFADNKYFMVRLRNMNALMTEGERMGHCGDFQNYEIVSGKSVYYSLRNCYNEPHATLKFVPESNTLKECKGKQDHPPIEKYFPYIKEFIIEKNVQIDEAVSNTGIVYWNDAYHGLYNLPDNITLSIIARRGDPPLLSKKKMNIS
jgi:hypothetical protein